MFKCSSQREEDSWKGKVDGTFKTINDENTKEIVARNCNAKLRLNKNLRNSECRRHIGK